MLTSYTTPGTGLLLSPACKDILQLAQLAAKDNLHATVAAPHLLQALLHKDFPLRKELADAGKDIYFMDEWIDIRLEELPRSIQFNDESVFDDYIPVAIEEADNVKVELNREEIDPHALLAAICTSGVVFGYDQLRTFPLTREEVIALALKDTKRKPKSPSTGLSNTVLAANPVSRYLINKNEEIGVKPHHTISGREKELRQMTEILSRRYKTNILLTGDPGVGKTALVYGFVQTLIRGIVPASLREAVVLQVDIIALAAGAAYKGEAEERMKKVLLEAETYEKPVLFIDDFHILADKSRGLQGVLDLLKAAMTKEQFTIISATHPDHFRKHIEADETLIRHFEMITVAEPDNRSSAVILDAVLPEYEKHHNVHADISTREDAIRLARRFLKERKLPDTAIDLLDRTMAAKRAAIDTIKAQTELLHEKWKDVKQQQQNTDESAVQDFLNTAKKRLGFLTWNKAEGEAPHHFAATSGEEFLAYPADLLTILEKLQQTITAVIDSTDIAVTVAEKTGIPAGKLQSQEKDRLLSMEQHLSKRVVGQEHALKDIAEAILESRSGLKKAGQPMGSFFFLGPTGTGKTELAKSLTEFLFHDERFLIRFDMSEFKEEHSAALLYGAPPGYVGYEEGGLLVNKIRQQPYAVVLFDEIEKAHASLFDVFLQIMDEGKLHDRLGKEGDFSNALVLFTSNIASDHIVKQFNKGLIPSSAELMEIMSRHFRPEFLGRLTGIIPFAPISEPMLLEIFSIHLKELVDSLQMKGIDFAISAEAKMQLARQGFTPQYGARPVKGVIRDQLRRPLSRMLVAETVQPGNKVSVEWDEAAAGLKWIIN